MTTFKIEGLAEINRVLGEIPKGLGRATLVRFGKKRLEPMRDTAKAKAPVDEGELRDEIIISTRQRSGGTKGRAKVDRAAVEINMGPSSHVSQKAVPQEFGFRGRGPVGFMRGAWDQHATGLLDNLAEDLGEAVLGAAARHAKRQSRKQG